MRKTVTLEPDVERLVKETMKRNGCSFKETINSAIRAGLGGERSSGKRAPFVIKAKPLGLRPGVDPARLNQLVDELEVEAFVEKTWALERRY
jgi:hypothetical protein